MVEAALCWENWKSGVRWNEWSSSRFPPNLILIIIQAKGAGEQYSFAATTSSSTHVPNVGPTTSGKSFILKISTRLQKDAKSYQSSIQNEAES
jgi:hypothetical protein